MINKKKRIKKNPRVIKTRLEKSKTVDYTFIGFKTK